MTSSILTPMPADSAAISSIVKTARIAGVLYLIVAICGSFAQIVRTTVLEQGDATGTASNILDSILLFRVGFSSDLIAFSAEVALALMIYVLFKPINEGLALLAAFFRLAQATALGINMLNQFLAIVLLTKREYFAAFSNEQLDSLVLLYMEAQNYGYLIGLIFFGLSSLVLGFLVVRSGYCPAILGIFLMTFVAFGYILDSFTSFLMEDKADMISVLLIAPAALSELAFILWLLIKGVRTQSVSASR